MRTLNVRTARPVNADHQLKPPLRTGTQIEMILQQSPDQLTAVLLQARFQLPVLKPTRLLAGQPARQRTEQPSRA